MANQENERCPDIISVLIAHRKGLRLNPCSTGCEKSPQMCRNEEDGLSHDPSIGGAFCLRARKPVTILEEK